jgi:uncharacterized membrane protein required for colicin V production
MTTQTVAPRSPLGFAGRSLVALLVFVVLAVLSLLLPRRMPGELSGAELTPHAAPACQSCPPTEQITGAALATGEDAWHLNLRFAARPFNSVLRISFAGVPDVIELRQAGDSWRYSGPSIGGMPPITSVAQRGNQLVLTLPLTLRTTGVAVSTASGDRMPASNFLSPVYPSPAHGNVTDAVLVCVLLATAWFGYRRGLVPEAANLTAMLLSMAIAAAASRPLFALGARIASYPRAGAALGCALLIVCSGIAGLVVVPRLFRRFGLTAIPLHPFYSGALGATAACVRQLAVLAMVLAVGTDLAILNWASSSVHSSLLGAPLIHAWKTLFPA